MHVEGDHLHTEPGRFPGLLDLVRPLSCASQNESFGKAAQIPFAAFDVQGSSVVSGTKMTSGSVGSSGSLGTGARVLGL